MRKISAVNFTENQNTQFILTCFWKAWHLWNYVETYSRVGTCHRRQHNTTYAICVLGKSAAQTQSRYTGCPG